MNDITIIKFAALYFIACALLCSHLYMKEQEEKGFKKSKWYEKAFMVIAVGTTTPILWLIAFVINNFRQLAREK